MSSSHFLPPCQTSADLESYPAVDQGELKKFEPNFKAQVGVWAEKNHLQDYQIDATVIRMFDAEFLRNLPEVSEDNPWPLYPTTRNYRTRFVGQAD
jgi:hypothetical protein